MLNIETVVIGAGVVGLAVARALALKGHEVALIERAGHFGEGNSSRNSEVIHAGLYYPEGSLKARLCVEGRERLYAYCQDRGIPFRRCGKIVVASEEADIPRIEAIARQGAINGVDDLTVIDRRELLRLEPDLSGVSALLSPSTGIVDSHALMLTLLGEAQSAGAMTAFSNTFVSGIAVPNGIALRLRDASLLHILARHVVNAAGLDAWRVSRSIEGVTTASIPPRYLCKGNYFALKGRSPTKQLVYPVPEPGGLGVHLTLDLAGQARFGPDVEWVSEASFDVPAERGESFYRAIRRYWPGLPDAALIPAYAGIRPKVSGPGEPAGDFIIQSPEITGVPGYVVLYGIESPGLTAALAIADQVVSIIR